MLKIKMSNGCVLWQMRCVLCVQYLVQANHREREQCPALGVPIHVAVPSIDCHRHVEWMTVVKLLMLELSWDDVAVRGEDRIRLDPKLDHTYITGGMN